MTLDWTLEEARPSDAEAIASLFALSWASPFSQLQFGDIDPSVLVSTMTPRIAQQITESKMCFVVARHNDTQQVISVAQWTVPDDKPSTSEESAEDISERQRFADEIFYNSLPDSCNKALVMEFTTGLRNLRQQVLQGRSHFLLENLATHPEYRGQGLARRLVEWAFPAADALGALVYLDTASDNKAMVLYRKLGFQSRGRHRIEDLSRFVGREELEQKGVGLEHTHVAMVRYPTIDVRDLKHM
jgi:ribosomal protein S18 acetylase RimI-like enzyme